MTTKRLVSTFALALAMISLSGLLAACSSGSDGPTSPAPMPTPTPTPATGSATFQVTGGASAGTLSYTSADNFIQCTTVAGWADSFLRFAEQPGANGEAGPHLDIDLCGSANSGGFTPKDPQLPACAGGQQFDIFWHGADGVFTNTANDPGCSFTLTRTGNQLSGTFSCMGMVEFGGTRTLDVLNGTFQCVEQ